MSQLITIESVTANTPVEIYYCDSLSGNCQYVATVSVFPFIFEVPTPYDEQDFLIKIIDTQGCIDGDFILVTPTPTPTITATFMPTPSVTQTTTPTQTGTPTMTQTVTLTQTLTPSITPTLTTTPVISSHAVGTDFSSTATNACSITISVVNYFTYISEANLVPVIGAIIYTTAVGGVLFNPYNGNNKFIKMVFGGTEYAVQINTVGQILSFVSCF